MVSRDTPSLLSGSDVYKRQQYGNNSQRYFLFSLQAPQLSASLHLTPPQTFSNPKINNLFQIINMLIIFKFYR